MLEIAGSEAGGLESVFLLTGSCDSKQSSGIPYSLSKAHLGHQIVEVQVVVSWDR